MSEGCPIPTSASARSRPTAPSSPRPWYRVRLPISRVSLRGYDDEFAGRCLATARLTWDQHHLTDPPDAEYLRWHASFALLDAALYRHGASEDLGDDLETRVAHILAQQKPEGVFPFPRSCEDYREQVLGAPREERAKLPDLSPAQEPLLYLARGLRGGLHSESVHLPARAARLPGTLPGWAAGQLCPGCAGPRYGPCH